MSNLPIWLWSVLEEKPSGFSDTKLRSFQGKLLLSLGGGPDTQLSCTL